MSVEPVDISHPLSAATAVWPGDRPFEMDWTMRRDAGDSVNVAAIRMSVHCGTHVDGPLHTGEGAAAGSLPLAPFIGPAVVVDARPWLAGEPPEVPPGVLDDLDPVRTPRLLLRTRDDADPSAFPTRFAALSPALCRRLAAAGFVLVGTDAPSVDPMESKELPAHRALAEAGIPNLENLDLTGVEPGRYVLVALPLKLADADSAPVRAVLFPDPGWAGIHDPSSGTHET